MVTNATIGIVYRPTDWTGGVYYILNFIIALRNSESCKPKIILFCDSKKDFDFIREQTNYPDLEIQLIPVAKKLNLLQQKMDTVVQKLRSKSLYSKHYKKSINFIFPFSYDEYFSEIKNKVYWLPDLQDKFYPEFFDENTIKARDIHYQKLAKMNQVVVFSSASALDDYKKFYPNYSFKPFILHFASFHDAENILDESTLRKKYNLKGHVFYSPNQFWRHKNHMVVIEAAKLAKESGKEFTIAFSGNENDPRSPGYINELKESVKESGLENEVKFLGFIDRSDVFGLMKMASSVIQPSKFEGWSTVVEDALSMNAFLLLADLKVNREQINSNVLFFHPDNATFLAELMNQVMDNKINKSPINYFQRRKTYSEDICNFINYVSSQGK